MDKSYTLDLDTWEALTVRLDEEWDQLSRDDIEEILFAREKLMEQAIERISESPQAGNNRPNRWSARVAKILERDERIMDRMQKMKQEASRQIRRLRETSRLKEGYDISAVGFKADSMFFDKKR